MASRGADRRSRKIKNGVVLDQGGGAVDAQRLVHAQDQQQQPDVWVVEDVLQRVEPTIVCVSRSKAKPEISRSCQT